MVVGRHGTHQRIQHSGAARARRHVLRTDPEFAGDGVHEAPGVAAGVLGGFRRACAREHVQRGGVGTPEVPVVAQIGGDGRAVGEVAVEAAVVRAGIDVHDDVFRAGRLLGTAAVFAARQPFHGRGNRALWQRCGPRTGSTGYSEVHARADSHQGRAPAQPEGDRPGSPPQRAHGGHRAFGFRQVVARARHPLCGGPAALRRGSFHLRQAVPRPP